MSNVDQIVARMARQAGLDPQAVLGVEHVESGGNPGSIGDHGTSFGLFQLHRGGALGSMSAQAALDPIQNARVAIAGMLRAGARGLKGRAAIEAIVNGFERPADPAAEIAKALGFYGGYGGASSNAGGSGSFTGGDNTGDNRSAIVESLLNANAKSVGIPGITLPSSFSPGVSGMSGPSNSGGGGFIGTGGYPAGKHGKLIGFPNQGTHTLGNWESDNAVDISLPYGTPIVASFDGRIGDQFGSLGSGNPRFAGLRLHLVGHGQEAYYAHLSRFAPGISPGTVVHRGQIIGYSGAANGVNHLHFAVLHGDPRSYAN